MSAKLGEGMWVKATQEVYNIPQGIGLNKELNVSKLKVLNCDRKTRADESVHLTATVFISTCVCLLCKNTVRTARKPALCLALPIIYHIMQKTVLGSN